MKVEHADGGREGEYTARDTRKKATKKRREGAKDNRGGRRWKTRQEEMFCCQKCVIFGTGGLLVAEGLS